MSMHVFLLSGVAMSCQNKKQTIVVFSSIKLEFIYVVLIVKEAMWFHQLFNAFGFLQSKALPFHCDNKSCIALTLNIQFHDYTKHIEIQYHFL
jgi:hypothetical protein